MTMTFKEACKDVFDTVETCLTDKENYKLVMKILVVCVLGFSSLLSGLFAIIGTVSIIFIDIDNLREGFEWWVIVGVLVSGSTGFVTAVLSKMWRI